MDMQIRSLPYTVLFFLLSWSSIFGHPGPQINCLTLELFEITPESCTGAGDGAIAALVSGGIPPYTWAWSNGASTPYGTNGLPKGIYQLTVTDSEGCTGTLNNIEVPGSLIIDITADTTICGGDDLSLFVDAPLALSYEWIASEPLSCMDCPNPTILSPFLSGEYIVTVTGPDACEETSIIYVQVNQYLDFGLLPFSNSPLCKGDTLFFEPNVFGAQSYQWSGPGNFSASESHPFIVNVSEANAGTYHFDLVDNAGCEIGVEFDVLVEQPPGLTVDLLQPTCLGDCDGQISLTITDEGTPPTAVLWNTGSDENTINGLCAGEYSVTVTDQYCEVEQQYFLPEPDSLIVAINPDTVICNGGLAQLYVDAPTGYTYQWAPTTGLDNPIVANPLAMPPTTTTYTVTVTDINGCSQTAETTIYVTDQDCFFPLVDTIEVGEIATWCDPTMGPLGFEVTEITCGPQGFVNFSVDSTLVCYSYEGLEIGTDTICIKICIGGMPESTCQDYQLAIRVTDEQVWPGDTNNDGIANHFDLLPLGIGIDSSGPLRPNASLDWIGQEAPGWSSGYSHKVSSITNLSIPMALD